MDDEIDLRDIFGVLWKRRHQVIGVFVIAIMVAGVISFVLPPVYKISSIIAIGNSGDPIYTSPANLRSIILSDEYLQEVLEQISPKATESKFQAFKESVKVTYVQGSDLLVEISIETKDKHEGLMAVDRMLSLYYNRSEDNYNRQKKILSDQLADTVERLNIINTEINQTRDALEGIKETLGTSTVQGEMQYSRTLDRLNGMESQRTALKDRSLDLDKQLLLLRNVEIVQPAREPITPIGPQKGLIVAIAGMLGMVIGIIAAFVREWQERSVK